jgi:hypothetical protein
MIKPVFVITKYDPTFHTTAINILLKLYIYLFHMVINATVV